MNQDIPIRTPDTLDEDGPGRHGEVTGRCPRDGGQAREGLGDVISMLVRRSLRGVQVDLSTDGPDPPRIGVDDAASDSDGGW